MENRRLSCMIMLADWFTKIWKSSTSFKMMPRITPMTENISQYLSVVKVRFLEEWNVSISQFFLMLSKETVLQIVILILARSAWSRAKKPVVEIGDLSKEESMEYLTKKRNLN